MPPAYATPSMPIVSQDISSAIIYIIPKSGNIEASNPFREKIPSGDRFDPALVDKAPYFSPEEEEFARSTVFVELALVEKLLISRSPTSARQYSSV